MREAMAQRRRERFVGRRTELDVLEHAFRESAKSAQLVTLLGPAGVGKTTIARRFCDDIQAKGSTFFWVGGEDTAPNAHDILEALAAQGCESFEDLGRGDAPDVLVFDAFERFVPLARWFFETLLPTVGSHLLIVLTTRERIDARLRTALALQLDMAERVVGNLSFEEAATTLRRARVQPSLHADIYALSQGHPLLVALFADRYAGSTAGCVDRSDTSDILSTLVRELLREAPTEEHRQALYALSLGTALDADLLRVLTQDPSFRRTFDWLAERSFTSPVPDGISPHALVRDALFADFVASHPVQRQTLADRMLDELERRFLTAPLERRLQLILEMLAIRRDLPFIRDALGLERMSRFHLRRGTAADAEVVARWVASFEGPTAAKLFHHWHALQPDGFFVIGDESPEPAGVFFNLRVGDTTPDQRAADPLVANAWKLLAGWNAASGRTDDLGFARWFFNRGTNQAFGAEFTAIMFCGPIIFSEDPRPLRHIAFYVTEPDRWLVYDPAFGMLPVDERVELDGLGYHPRVRELMPAEAIDVLTPLQRQIGSVRGLLTTAGVVRSEALTTAEPLLTETEFHKAVRAALPLLHRRHELKDNPLVAGAMVRAPRPLDRLAAADALSKLLVDACAALPNAKGILETTFVRPAVKQQAAAAELGLPYGTYRYQLRAATELLAKELWEREKAARTA